MDLKYFEAVSSSNTSRENKSVAETNQSTYWSFDNMFATTQFDLDLYQRRSNNIRRSKNDILFKKKNNQDFCRTMNNYENKIEKLLTTINSKDELNGTRDSQNLCNDNCRCYKSYFKKDRRVVISKGINYNNKYILM